MQTGDGLLVRLMPIGTIQRDAFAGLCRAAREHGNGIVEITARGSIQVRGLSATSAPLFAQTIGALDIAAAEGVPVLSNALAGLDPTEILDAAMLAADLRRALADASLAGCSELVIVVWPGACIRVPTNKARRPQKRAPASDPSLRFHRFGNGRDGPDN